MDPTSALSALVNAIKFLYAVAKAVKENQRECQHLARLATRVVEIINESFHEGNVPPKLIDRVNTLTQ